MAHAAHGALLTAAATGAFALLTGTDTAHDDSGYDRRNDCHNYDRSPILLQKFEHMRLLSKIIF